MLELEELLIVIQSNDLLCFGGEELVKTGLAIGQKVSSELAIPDVFDCGLESLELELESHDLLAEVSVEDAVLALALGFLENALYHYLHVVDPFLRVPLVDLGVVTGLVGELDAAEHVLTQFNEFLVEVIGSDDVDDETNLLVEVFVSFGDLLEYPLGLTGQLVLELVSDLPAESLLLSEGGGNSREGLLLSWLEATDLHFVLGLLVVVLASPSAFLVMVSAAVAVVVVVGSLVAAREGLLLHGGVLDHSVFLLGPESRLGGSGALADDQFLEFLENRCLLCARFCQAFENLLKFGLVFLSDVPLLHL